MRACRLLLDFPRFDLPPQSSLQLQVRRTGESRDSIPSKADATVPFVRRPDDLQMPNGRLARAGFFSVGQIPTWMETTKGALGELEVNENEIARHKLILLGSVYYCWSPARVCFHIISPRSPYGWLEISPI